MSVVVIRDGIIAADSNGQIGNLKIQASKLVTRNGVVIGCVGNHGDGRIFADWYFDGADLAHLPDFRIDRAPDFAAIVMTVDGWEYWSDSFFRDTNMQTNPYFAIGTGDEVAMGALHAGATAIQAVEAACAHETCCSLPVDAEGRSVAGHLRAWHESEHQRIEAIDVAPWKTRSTSQVG